MRSAPPLTCWRVRGAIQRSTTDGFKLHTLMRQTERNAKVYSKIKSGLDKYGFWRKLAMSASRDMQ